MEEGEDMKILYYDVFCGISGDMNLGALIDLGVPKSHLIEELKKVNLKGEYHLEIKTDMKKSRCYINRRIEETKEIQINKYQNESC